MPGIFCCFGAPSPDAVSNGPVTAGSKEVLQSPDTTPAVPVAVSAKPEHVKDGVSPRCASPATVPRLPSPAISANLGVANLFTSGRPVCEAQQGLLQGLDFQRRVNLLQGHWWKRVEDALELLSKTYAAACASVWILDEGTESFVALLSKGSMRQAVQPGYALHLGSEYDANCPSSLTSLWDSKAAQTYRVGTNNHSSNSSSLHNRFPADWKLLYNAHHFTDFLAVPILSTPSADGAGLAGADKAASNPSDSIASATALVSALGGTTTSGPSAAAGAANAGVAVGSAGGAAGSEAAAGGAAAGASGGFQVVGAVTVYLSRPGADQVSEPSPSIFASTVEQELVSLAFSSLLFASGPEPVRQVCETVLAIQSAAGSGEVAAAVAAGLQARLRHVLSVTPIALMALVPPRHVSAVVFRDLTAAAAEAANMDSLAAGQSSSQTLPLLHPALASVAGAGGGGNAASCSGSHSHGGLRVQYRAAGIHVGDGGPGGASAIERSPSLLGTGLRGDPAGSSNAGVGPGPALGGQITEPGPPGGGGGGGGTRLLMPNSRSMGVLGNPSGLFSCRLDRMPSRYKALVYPLSHTLLQVVLQQRQERKAKEAARAAAAAGGAAAAAAARQSSALRDLCMSAAAATASGSGAFNGGWIVGDCNEHLHAVHSPSRDVYVMTRVNGRRPHSLVVATAELSGLCGIAEGAAGASVSASVAAANGHGGHQHGAGHHTGAATAGSATYIAVYLAFPERLPRPLLEMALTDTQLMMRRLIAPLIRHRFESSLAEEWTALAAAAHNMPSPGGPVLRIASSMSASQARHASPLPLPLPLLLSTADSPSAGPYSANPQATESNSNVLLARLGGPMSQQSGGGAAVCMSPSVGSAALLPTSIGNPGAATSASELHLEGLSAGEALQQMSVLVSSYMDTLQALQGQLMASDRIAESLRREDLPHLQLLEVLGHGGGGVVFRGKLHALEVAVKVFEVPGDLATAAGLSLGGHGPGGGKAGEGGGGAGGGGGEKQTAWPAVGDRRVLQRSALELAVTASMSHPHIIQVYSMYTNMVLVKQKPPKQGTSGVQLLELSAATAISRADEGIPCSALCMEYCDMGTLAHAIDQHRFLTVTPLGARRAALKAICTTLLEVALALRHLHARNLAHCDLKPANVLLKSSRRDSRGFTCKLADFGYVAVLKASVPGGRPTILPEEACGTVTHMAPETFIKGQPLDFSVDTFSFGILMWELYTCARPYSDVPEDQIAQRVTLKGLRPIFPSDTPRAYGTLARQCWSQDPNERPSASEIVSAIENMLQIMNTQLPAIPPLKPKATGTAGGAGTPPQLPAAPSPGGGGAGEKSPPHPGVAPLALNSPSNADRAQQHQLQQQLAPLRARGSMNGTTHHGASNLAQSPLGRAPASPATHATPAAAAQAQAQPAATDARAGHTAGGSLGGGQS